MTSYIAPGGTVGWGPSFIGNPAGGSSPPPAYTPAYKFNDVGGSGGGDRNSMYLPTLYGAF